MVQFLDVMKDIYEKEKQRALDLGIELPEKHHNDDPDLGAASCRFLVGFSVSKPVLDFGESTIELIEMIEAKTGVPQASTRTSETSSW